MMTKQETMQYEVGQRVNVTVEGSTRPLKGTVTARDAQRLSIRLNGEVVRFGFDAEEDCWYDEGESGNRVWVRT
jgi:hypothetical protein